MDFSYGRTGHLRSTLRLGARRAALGGSPESRSRQDGSVFHRPSFRSVPQDTDRNQPRWLGESNRRPSHFQIRRPLQLVSREEGSHEPTFADDGKHYVDSFSAVLTPPRLSICSRGNSCKTVWDSRSVVDYGLIAPKFLDFKADDDTTLRGELLLPANVALDAKIPLIVNVYGGPAGQLVRNEWIGTTGLFHQLLARRGCAIFSVDN